MTFDEFDEMVDKFDNIDTNKVWPTKEQIDMMENNPERWVKFLCYLDEKR